MLEELAALHELHYEVELGGGLEGVGEVHEVGVVYVG